MWGIEAKWSWFLGFLNVVHQREASISLALIFWCHDCGYQIIVFENGCCSKFVFWILKMWGHIFIKADDLNSIILMITLCICLRHHCGFCIKLCSRVPSLRNVFDLCSTRASSLPMGLYCTVWMGWLLSSCEPERERCPSRSRRTRSQKTDRVALSLCSAASPPRKRGTRDPRDEGGKSHDPEGHRKRETKEEIKKQIKLIQFLRKFFRDMN